MYMNKATLYAFRVQDLLQLYLATVMRLFKQLEECMLSMGGFLIGRAWPNNCGNSAIQ